MEPLWGSWGALGGGKGLLGSSWRSLWGLLGHRKIIEKPYVLLCFRNIVVSGGHWGAPRGSKGTQGETKGGPRRAQGRPRRDLWASKGAQGGPRGGPRAPSGTRAFAKAFFRVLERSLLGNRKIIEKPYVLLCFRNLRGPRGNLGGALGGPGGSRGGQGNPRGAQGWPKEGPRGGQGGPVGVRGGPWGSPGRALGTLGDPF